MDTTKLDDLLNQAEAQEAEQGEWIKDTNYTTKSFYVDEHGVVDVENKTIGDMSKHISVKGESYSQYIEFKIGRFFDGIDLTKMQLAIYYEIPNVGSDESRPINVYYNENEIKFGWVIPPEVAQENLTIEFCIYARGILSDGNNYILKTKTAKYSINDGLEIGSGIIEPTNNWYLNFVLEMDQKVAQASENADRAVQAASSLDGVVETVTTARDEVTNKASIVDTQHSEVRAWHQETKQFRDEAEQFRNQAEAITGIGLAEEGKPGLVQPDGVTTKVTEDGKLVVIGGGGETPGTTDYQALDNKPSIAGVELSGDKSLDDLGIASKDSVERNFETVNQNFQTLGEFTQQLDQDISALDTEIEATNTQLESTTDKVDNLTERTESGFKVEVVGKAIHLTDAVDGKVVDFAMYGKSEQKQYSGKNLLNVDVEQGYPSNTDSANTTQRFFDDDTYIVGIAHNNYMRTANVNNFQKTESGFIVTMHGGYGVGYPIKDIDVSKKYTLSFDVLPAMTTNMVGLACYDINGNWLKGQNLDILEKTHYETTFTIPEGTERCVVVIASNATEQTQYTISNLQFEKSESATEYEPYTGGIPSPNPDYPQEIEIAGASGSIEVTSTNEDASKSTSSIIPTPNGLLGIKVDTNGNYTDENGQQWITDEIVRYADGSGEYIQRIGKERLQTIESSYPSTEGNLIGIISTNAKNVSNNNIVGNIISNMYSITTANIQYTTNMSAICVMNKSGVAKIGISNKDVSTIDELTAFLNENEVIALYELAETITTPLTAEQLSEIDKLKTFKPITNISNNEQCGMKITYATLQEALMLQEAYNVSRDNAEEIVDIKKELSDTTFKVDIIIEKADLGIKETASGEEIHLIDSAEGKAVEFALYGKATQDGEPTPENPQEIEVSGESYNLLPIIATSKTENGGNIIVNDDNSININGTFTNTTYHNLDFTTHENAVFDVSKIVGEKVIGSISNTTINGVTLNFGYFKKDNTSTEMYSTSNSIEFSYPSEAVKSRCYLCVDGGTYNNVTIYPMIRKASVKNDRYMPYGKGSVEVKSLGSNILNNTDYELGNYGNDGKPITGTTVYRFNKEFSVIPNETLYLLKKLVIYWYSDNLTFISMDSTGKLSLTVPQGAKYAKARIFASDFGTFNNNDYMVSRKPIAEYEPYKESKAIINGEFAGIKVSSGGNYTDQNGQQWICDEVVKYADGSGEKIEGIKHYSLAVADMNNSDDYPGWKMPFTDDLVEVIGEGINRQYTDVTLNIGQNVNFNTTSNNKAIFLSKATYGMTQTEWKANYPDLVVDIYIARVTPIRTPLTAEEIAEISTFYPVTNISNDFECGMRIEYVGDSIITTNTEIPVVMQDGEPESGDNIVTLFGKIAKKLNSLIGSDVQQQLADIVTRLDALEQNQKTIIYSDIEPETVEENTIVMVYETEE